LGGRNIQPITEEELNEIIKEAKQAGKDVSKLEMSLETMRSKTILSTPPVGQKIERAEGQGTVIIESTGPAREDDFDSGKTKESGQGTSGILSEEPISGSIAKVEDAVELFGGAAGGGLGELYGKGYAWGRHDCGNGHGTFTHRINCPVITPTSAVFISASEGHLGSARYTLHNIVPQQGFVLFNISIGWNFPIRLYVSLLVINP
jgi:hypothetical protein